MRRYFRLFDEISRNRHAGGLSIIVASLTERHMRNALIAFVLLLAVPAATHAGGYNFFFGVSSGYGGYCGSPYFYTSFSYPFYGYPYYGGYYHRPYYRPYYRGYHGYYGGGYYGRYAVPRVYSPYRYGDYVGDRHGLYGYQRDYAYRRGPTRNYDRGYYYGPAVERYHRNARDYPSYHYGRREMYNRGSDRSYADRSSRYR
jgi:hypothetical protein